MLLLEFYLLLKLNAAASQENNKILLKREKITQ